MSHKGNRAARAHACMLASHTLIWSVGSQHRRRLCHFTSVCMCASFSSSSSSHPSICADGEQGSILIDKLSSRLLMYSYHQLYFFVKTGKPNRAEILGAHVWTWAHFLPFAAHGMERGSVRCCCRRAGPSSSSSSLHWQRHPAPLIASFYGGPQ